MAELHETARGTQPAMLRKRLFVILTTPLRPEDELAPVIADHINYVVGLEKSGVLFASGPFLSGPGVRPGSGMTIVRTSSAEEAAALAEKDPFTISGLRSYEVREWQVNEGRYTVTVDYSDGSYGIG